MKSIVSLKFSKVDIHVLIVKNYPKNSCNKILTLKVNLIKNKKDEGNVTAGLAEKFEVWLPHEWR
ncbi:MAG: hypothetical protein B0W54_15010 [Cellvibrio sp. 79]|nr:MAG: hypothetical protein B0W54_15010 [Cellvibrio sp. 79]